MGHHEIERLLCEVDDYVFNRNHIYKGVSIVEITAILNYVASVRGSGVLFVREGDTISYTIYDHKRVTKETIDDLFYWFRHFYRKKHKFKHILD